MEAPANLNIGKTGRCTFDLIGTPWEGLDMGCEVDGVQIAQCPAIWVDINNILSWVTMFFCAYTLAIRGVDFCLLICNCHAFAC